jgi:hypothetical protein
MGYFSWVQAVIVGKSGGVVESSSENQLRVTNKDFLTSHRNTVLVNTTLDANKNYFSNGMMIINSGVTLTIPPTTLLEIQ